MKQWKHNEAYSFLTDIFKFPPKLFIV